MRKKLIVIAMGFAAAVGVGAAATATAHPTTGYAALRTPMQP